jgi:multicomponent K+:H+ antiporter subunit D
MPEPAYVAYGIKEFSVYRRDEEIGIALPGAIAFLGLMFVCCVLLVTGLPPLAGFVAKFALLSTALGATPVAEAPWTTWAFFAAILLSGFASLIALSRVGMRLFWSVAERATPRLRLLEAAPAGALVLLCLGLSVAAGPVARYLDSAARSLHEPDTYVRAVLSGHSNEPTGSGSP